MKIMSFVLVFVLVYSPDIIATPRLSVNSGSNSTFIINELPQEDSSILSNPSIKQSPELFIPSPLEHKFGRKKIITYNRENDRVRKDDYSPLSVSDSVSAAWVSHYESGLNQADDGATDIAISPNGEIVVVTGFSVGSLTGYDYATVKYNSLGVEWIVRYDGPASSNDIPTALVMDKFGNVYVTGYSMGTDGSYDYATIKYNNAGVEQWIARYNGIATGLDYAVGIVVDDSLNVIVTGVSQGVSTYNDYLTIKYDENGIEKWIQRYDGTGNGPDYATDIALDQLGNVYVTGGSVSLNNSYDYTTIKYNPPGVEQWVGRYDGPSHGSDEASAITLDNKGNVYITGESSDSANYFSDYATVKYDNLGVLQWVSRYDGASKRDDKASSIAIDNNSNVYITGSSYQTGYGFDYLTIKYDSSGKTIWSMRYDGGFDDYAHAMSIDQSGNVYVTGGSNNSYYYSDCATIKYSSDGAQLWSQRYNGSADNDDQASGIAVDVSGNVYVTGYTSQMDYVGDYLTIVYRSSGEEKWKANYRTNGYSSDQATAMVMDDSGDVYITGASISSVTKDDYATIKVNSAGVIQWIARYNGTANGVDHPIAIALDKSNNVYVTGQSYSSDGTYDFATVKYNSSGVEQWNARYNGSGGGDDRPVAVVVDDFGNLYVTGESPGAGSSSDYLTIKYNSSGVQQWVARFNAQGNGSDYPKAMVIDGSGCIYVTGSCYYLDKGLDYTTVKYDNSGNLRWWRRFVGATNADDIATAMAIDDSANIYVTGYNKISTSGYDYLTLKYDSSGNDLWEVRYDINTANQYASAITIDKQRNILVTGYGENENYYYDYITVKYNNQGDGQWVATYNGPSNGYDYARSITTDDAGNAYVAGYSSTGIQNTFATVKYNTYGDQQWVATYNKLSSTDDKAFAVAADNTGSVIVGGTTSFSGSVYTVIKYTQLSVGIEDKEKYLPNEYRLYQNFPNPFNPSSTFNYDIKNTGHVKITIYNTLGQGITDVINEVKEPGSYSKVWNALGLASGLYIYKMEFNGVVVDSKKMILMK
jgi:uncharacterized delta-60 repeat protein